MLNNFFKVVCPICIVLFLFLTAFVIWDAYKSKTQENEVATIEETTEETTEEREFKIESFEKYPYNRESSCYSIKFVPEDESFLEAKYKRHEFNILPKDYETLKKKKVTTITYNKLEEYMKNYENYQREKEENEEAKENRERTFEEIYKD